MTTDLSTIRAPWKCCVCGAVSVDRERTCDCVTNVLFRKDGDESMVHAIKIEKPEITIDLLRELVAIQAEDDALWAPATHIETAYAQQALRFLTRAIECEWTFDEARDAIRDMMP